MKATPRRLDAAERKLTQALKVFKGTEIIITDVKTRLVPRLQVMNIQMHFTYRKRDLRWDYEIDLTQRLPLVGKLRRDIWEGALSVPYQSL